MVKLMLVRFWLLSLMIINLNSSNLTVTNALAAIEDAKTKSLITVNMPSFNQFEKVDLKVISGPVLIKEEDFSLRHLYYLRAFCRSDLQSIVLGKEYPIVSANAALELRVLQGIITNGIVPNLKFMDPNIQAYILRLKAQREEAFAALDEAQHALETTDIHNSPPRQHALQYSPAVAALQLTVNPIYQGSPSHGNRRTTNSDAMLYSLEYSPIRVRTNMQVGKQIRQLRRAEHMLKDELCLTQGERDTALKYVGVLGNASEASQTILGLQNECLSYQQQISRCVELIRKDMSKLTDDIARLQELEAFLKQNRDSSKETLEFLLPFVKKLPGYSDLIG